jgi:hypothetical protein
MFSRDTTISDMRFMMPMIIEKRLILKQRPNQHEEKEN